MRLNAADMLKIDLFRIGSSISMAPYPRQAFAVAGVAGDLQLSRLNNQFRRRRRPVLFSPRRQPAPTCSATPVWKRQLPTILTLARVAAVPLLTAVYLLPPFRLQRTLSTGIFVASSITDFFDGFLARRWGVCTPLGAFLDPVADKLLVCAALVCIVSRLNAPGLVLSTAVILVREIFVSALREWMAARGARDDVQVGGMGKAKTTAQMVAVILLLAAGEAAGGLAVAGSVLLAVSAVLAVVSAARYLGAAMPVLMQTEK